MKYLTAGVIAFYGSLGACWYIERPFVGIVAGFVAVPIVWLAMYRAGVGR